MTTRMYCSAVAPLGGTTAFDPHTFMDLLNDEARVGATAAAVLIPATPTERTVLLRDHPEWLRTGTFDILLKHAREEVDRNLTRAEELTAFVLDHLAGITVADEFLLDRLHGIAHKDHATVLFRRRDNLAGAREHIEEAVRLLSCRAALAPNRASARFVQAQIWHAMQETDVALAILSECEAIFAKRGDAHRYVQTLAQRGICYFELADDCRVTAPDIAADYFDCAHDAFTRALAESERTGDERERARLLNSLGHWAVEVNALEEARTYFTRALEGFQALDMTGEVQRALWGIAEIDARQGRIDHAVNLLRRVHQEFLDRGMAADAGIVYVDITRKLDEQRPDLGVVHGELLYFAQAMNVPSVPRPARSAALFLAARASSGASRDELQSDMGRVYDFFTHFKRDPAASFDATAA